MPSDSEKNQREDTGEGAMMEVELSEASVLDIVRLFGEGDGSAGKYRKERSNNQSGGPGVKVLLPIDVCESIYRQLCAQDPHPWEVVKGRIRMRKVSPNSSPSTLPPLTDATPQNSSNNGLKPTSPTIMESYGEEYDPGQLGWQQSGPATNHVVASIAPTTVDEEEKDRRYAMILTLRERFSNLEVEEIERYSNCHEYDFPKVLNYLQRVSNFKKQMADGGVRAPISSLSSSLSTTSSIITRNSSQTPTKSFIPPAFSQGDFPQLGSPTGINRSTSVAESQQEGVLIKFSQSPVPIQAGNNRYSATRSSSSTSANGILPIRVGGHGGGSWPSSNQRRPTTMREVETLREEAKQLQAQKREYQEKANNARGTQPHAVSHYSQEALKYDRLAKEKLREADMALLSFNISEPTIDLHYLTLDRARRVMKMKIDYMREHHPQYKQLRVITGYGRGKKASPVVKNELTSYLDGKRIGNYVDSANLGLIVVELVTVKERLCQPDEWEDWNEEEE